MLNIHLFANCIADPVSRRLPRSDRGHPGQPSDELDPFDDNDNSGMDGYWNDDEDHDDSYVPPRSQNWPARDFPARLAAF